MADKRTTALTDLLGRPEPPNLRKYWEAGRLVGDRIILEGDRGSALVEKLGAEPPKSGTRYRSKRLSTL